MYFRQISKKTSAKDCCKPLNEQITICKAIGAKNGDLKLTLTEEDPIGKLTVIIFPGQKPTILRIRTQIYAMMTSC